MNEPFAPVDARARFELEDLLPQCGGARGARCCWSRTTSTRAHLGARVLVLSPSPATIVADLPADPDQIATRESAPFVALRSEVAR
jgi:NitT/TauT family transport system ATP-binding protein